MLGLTVQSKMEYHDRKGTPRDNGKAIDMRPQRIAVLAWSLAALACSDPGSRSEGVEGLLARLAEAAPLAEGAAASSHLVATRRPPVDLPTGEAGKVAVDVLRAEPHFAGGVLVLLQERTGPRRVVPMIVGDGEGLAISLRLEGREYERPLTHDLLETVLSRYGVRVVDVEIVELRGTTFIATLRLEDAEGRIAEIDSRPSDGIALALGAGRPIYVSERVIAQVGEPPGPWGAPLPEPPARRKPPE